MDCLNVQVCNISPISAVKSNIRSLTYNSAHVFVWPVVSTLGLIAVFSQREMWRVSSEGKRTLASCSLCRLTSALFHALFKDDEYISAVLLLSFIKVLPLV